MVLFVPFLLLACDIWNYNFSSGPYITHFSAVVAKKQKNVEKIFVLKRANRTCSQPMTAVNLLHRHFKQLQYYTSSKWHCFLIQLLSVNKSSIT